MNKISHKILVSFSLLLSLFASAQPTSLLSGGAHQAANNEFASRMAPHLLRSVPENGDPDCASTRVWAYILLRMPYHASKSLEVHRDVVDSTERALFEANIARLISNQHSEKGSFVAEYLTLVGSSNKLFAAHLSNLGNVGGGGIVTNLPGADLDLRFLPQDLDKPIAVVRISKGWLTETCSKGSYDQLVDQLRLVAEMRQQESWRVVVAISPSPSEKTMSLEILNRIENGGSKHAPRFFIPADTVFKGTDEQRQIAIEDFILEALK